MPLPRDTLVLAEGRATTWYEFDADWYRRAYGVAGKDADTLADYLDTGQLLGRAPNVFFDETWYLRRYPDIAASVRDGRFASGFDHYCRDGLTGRSAHWLFQVVFYQSGVPELTAEILAAEGYRNSYDHFLRTGSAAGRLAHPLFDSAFYRTAQAAGESDAGSPFAEFLYRLSERQPETAASVYFDADWYVARYPEVARAIAAGQFLSALHHYSCNETPTAFDPLADFSEAHYAARHPDVAAAIAKGAFRNAYMHFLPAGVRELRSPAPHIDLRYYWSRNETCRRAVEAGQVRDAFAHLLTIGKPRGLALAPFPAPPALPLADARALSAAQAHTLLPLYGRRPLDFTLSGPATCSAIVVLGSGLALALRGLAALREQLQSGLELVLVDASGVDEVRQIERCVTGARVLRLDAEFGFGRACNAALESVGSDYVLLLASDVQLAGGALAAALARIKADTTIGAIGGKVIGCSETLDEAGAIIWRDGSITRYLEGQPPLSPEAEFVRDVDFCSGGFLLGRTRLLRELEGFDAQFEPTRFEAADLGVRIWQTGHRVVYDPAVVLRRYSDENAVAPHLAPALQRARHKAFFDKHLASLRFRHATSPAAVPFARAVDSRRRRVLFVDHTVPLRALGSGWVRANDIVRVMADLGYHVTVYPLRPTEADPAEIAADFPDTVEVMHDRALAGFRAFLESRPGYYDCIWVSRTHNLDLVRPVLEDAALVPSRTRIILDTEAVAATRSALQAAILGEAPAAKPDEALRKEFANAFFSQQVLTVNDQERRLLSGLGIPDVRVLGTLCEPRPTPRSFEQRAGMLFVGSLHATDTPNWDSLLWFADEVLPLVEAELGYETRLTVAGYQSPWVPMERFAHYSRITVIGPVVNLTPLYDRHRVAVAPTRFAAGTPYKVYEAASFGVPVVATALLREQLGWKDGVELLSADAADPAGFAARIVEIYRSAERWGAVRAAALERLQQENGWGQFASTLRQLLPPHDTAKDSYWQSR